MNITAVATTAGGSGTGPISAPIMNITAVATTAGGSGTANLDAALSVASSPANQDDTHKRCAQPYHQCGGTGWTGPTQCCTDEGNVHQDFMCTATGEFYAQCLPSGPACWISHCYFGADQPNTLPCCDGECVIANASSTVGQCATLPPPWRSFIQEHEAEVVVVVGAFAADFAMMILVRCVLRAPASAAANVVFSITKVATSTLFVLQMADRGGRGGSLYFLAAQVTILASSCLSGIVIIITLLRAQFRLALADAARALLDVDAYRELAGLYNILLLISSANLAVLALLPWKERTYGGLPTARLLRLTYTSLIFGDGPQICLQSTFVLTEGMHADVAVGALSLACAIISLFYRLIQQWLTGLAGQVVMNRRLSRHRTLDRARTEPMLNYSARRWHSADGCLPQSEGGRSTSWRAAPREDLPPSEPLAYEAPPTAPDDAAHGAEAPLEPPPDGPRESSPGGWPADSAWSRLGALESAVPALSGLRAHMLGTRRAEWDEWLTSRTAARDADALERPLGLALEAVPAAPASGLEATKLAS
jgi:hypothetical protein